MKMIFLPLATLVLLFSGCIGQEHVNGQQDKMRVVVTLMPQAEFVKSVGGGNVDVIVMVPPGASPHTYEPTPSQLAEVAAAKLYFKVGSGVEFEKAWMNDIENINPSMKVIDCSKNISLIMMDSGHEAHDDDEPEEHGDGHAHGGPDPHIWNSPRNAGIMVKNIYQALADEDPKNAAYYKANADNYTARLDALDASIKATLENRAGGKFIVFHPAWGYFAHHYGLEQVAIEKAGKEPTAQNLKLIIDTANEHNITVIFASPQFSTSNAHAIASQIRGSVVLIDPLDRDYLKNMQRIADAFASAFE